MEAIEIKPQFEDLDNANTLINHIKELTKDNVGELLNSLRINPHDELKPHQKAWEQIETNATLGTLENFSLIIGKAKSRKSFFINIAVSTVVNNDEVLGQFKGALPPNQRKVYPNQIAFRII